MIQFIQNIIFTASTASPAASGSSGLSEGIVIAIIGAAAAIGAALIGLVGVLISNRKKKADNTNGNSSFSDNNVKIEKGGISNIGNGNVIVQGNNNTVNKRG